MDIFLDFFLDFFLDIFFDIFFHYFNIKKSGFFLDFFGFFPPFLLYEKNLDFFLQIFFYVVKIEKKIQKKSRKKSKTKSKIKSGLFWGFFRWTQLISTHISFPFGTFFPMIVRFYKTAYLLKD